MVAFRSLIAWLVGLAISTSIGTTSEDAESDCVYAYAHEVLSLGAH